LSRDPKKMSQAADASQWRRDITCAISGIEMLQWSQSNTAASPELTQWTSVPVWTPLQCADGSRPSQWLYERGLLQHYPGDAPSQMWFQSPLRGEYEIRGRLSSKGYKEIALAVGMHAAMPSYDLTTTNLVTLLHGQRDLGKQFKFPVWDESAEYRILVQNNRVTTFVNGVQIHLEEFASPIDPWVVIQSITPSTFASIQNIQITGQPTIPKEIDLIDTARWSGWRANTYGDSFSENSDEQSPYFRNGDEMVGRLRKDRSASMVESLMMYARPMLEDGEIEFETFYVPAEFEVHPTIGRSAFLVDPAGVSLHRLTDAQWEINRRGIGKLESPISPSNRSPIEGSQASSWKIKDWNRVKLKVTGDQATIFVNDQQVAQQTIQEPKNERFFGLFRYSDKTQSRVRNLKYRGEWPTVLPSVSDQQMALPNEDSFAFPSDKIAETISIPLNQSIEQLAKQLLTPMGNVAGLQSSEKGILMTLKDGGVPAKWPGMKVSVPIPGDADITLDYRDLKMIRPGSGWGVGLLVDIQMADAESTVVEVGMAIVGNGNLASKASARRNFPNRMNSVLDLDHETVSGIQPSGQLRLVRRGGQVHCLYRATKGDGADGAIAEPTGPFQWIQSVTVGDAPIQRVTFQSKCSDAKGELTALLEKLEIVIAK
jgi:hypothetical protein